MLSASELHCIIILIGFNVFIARKVLDSVQALIYTSLWLDLKVIWPTQSVVCYFPYNISEEANARNWYDQLIGSSQSDASPQLIYLTEI